MDDAAACRIAHRSTHTEGGNTHPVGSVALNDAILTVRGEYTFNWARVNAIASGVHPVLRRSGI